MGSQQSGLVDLLLQANLELDGPDAGIETGYSVAGARDVNGDGRPDVLVGAPDVGASAGSAYVVYGFGVAKVAYAPVKAMVGHALAARKPKTLRRTGAPSFFVLPALPAGLRLDARSGVLSGTPRKVQPARRYTVTMTDLTGKTTAPPSIAVQASMAVLIPGVRHADNERAGAACRERAKAKPHRQRSRPRVVGASS